MKVCVFTAIFGDNEPIDNPQTFTKIDGWDYILFTNLQDKFKNTSWKIINVDIPECCKKLSKPFIYANRYYKWHSFEFLKEYDVVIYVDGFQIPNPIFENKWKKLADRVYDSKNPPLILAHHYSTIKCSYYEMQLIVMCKKDTFENMKRTHDYLRSKNFPEQYGIFWNGCFIYRQNDPTPIKIWKSLWNEMCIFTYRDQALLPYNIWKLIKQGEISNDIESIFSLEDLDSIIVKTDSNSNHVYVQ